MVFNLFDTHSFMMSLGVLLSAFVFYTIGVWAERVQKELKVWHLIFLVAGLFTETIGTSLVEQDANNAHFSDQTYTILGLIALFFIFIHVLWALWAYLRGSAQIRIRFRSSILFWCIWLIPYWISIYKAISMRP